ncbi:MAG: helix-turn-helix transcriptional regulator [Sphingobium sp.]
MPHANELLYRSYLAKARNDIAQLEQDDDIAGRVARALVASFLDGLTLSEVAKHIGKSPRALQRALQAQNLQFRDLVKDARIRHAQHLLRITSLPVSEISLQVGYGDLSGFSHAFKRITGTTARRSRARSGWGS